MRAGNLSSLSERDWAAIRERREFEKQEADRQRLSEDQIEYDKYVQIVEGDQSRVAPAYRIAPIPFEAWRAYTDPAISDPILRGVQATNKVLLGVVRTDEAVQLEAEREEARKAFHAGNRDPNWTMPENARWLRMSVEKAKAYAREQGKLFVEHNPEYFPNRANVDAITAYLIAQGITIPNEECFRLAWLRLRELGLIQERPAATPEPTLEPVETEPKPEAATEPTDDLLEGWDLQTGERRKYRPFEINRMSADEYRRVFRVSPRFTRGYFGR